MQHTAVRVALLGCGAVAQLYYAPALLALEAAGLLEVVALLDPDARNAERIRARFARARIAHDIPALLKIGFDLAIVASPHSLHASQAMRLLEAGVGVLCEKPMATRLADAEALAAAAARSPAPLAIGLVRRFFPATRTIRRILQLGVLGEITSFRFSEGSAVFGWPVSSVEYFRHQQAHGGVLMDIGAHALDLLLWWLGKPTEIDYADDAMGGVEANCLIRCKMACGASGEVRLSRDCSLANRYTIYGSRGWLSWGVNEADRFEIRFSGAAEVIQAVVPDATSSTFEQSFLSQLRNAVGAVRGTESLMVPASEGLGSLAIIEHCYRHRSLMALPWLDSREVARGRELNAAAQNSRLP